MKKAIAVISMFLFLFLLVGCSPTPKKTQVESAIRQSLLTEKTPPELDFTSLQVSTSGLGKAEATIWTADGMDKHFYTVKYDRKSDEFSVAGHTVKRYEDEPVRYYDPSDGSGVKSGTRFDFTEQGDSNYMLIYCGKGESLETLRAEFESERLSDFSSAITSQFEVCDLGGDTLVLLVPRYVGMSVDIYEVGSFGDALVKGDKVAEFGHMPVYIFCNFADGSPSHEIHVTQNENEHFFQQTRLY